MRCLLITKSKMLYGNMLILRTTKWWRSECPCVLCPATYFKISFPACLSVVRRWENLFYSKCAGWADTSYEHAHIRLNLLKIYLGLLVSVYVTLSRRNLSQIRKEISCSRLLYVGITIEKVVWSLFEPIRDKYR